MKGSGRFSSVWEFFEKDKDGNKRQASCKICNKNYSFATSITNLKKHLSYKHRDVCPEDFLKENKSKSCVNIEKQYFNIETAKIKLATCSICNEHLSFNNNKSLREHLKGSHPDAYEKYLKNIGETSDESVDSQNEDTSLDTNDDTQEPQKLNDIWKHFNQESDKARCVVCLDLIADTSYDGLKEHLFEQHPNLLLKLVQEQDTQEENHLELDSGSDNEENKFTEVVYLEQDPEPEYSRPRKSKTIASNYQRRAVKRTRNDSSSDRPIIKLESDKVAPKREDNELEAFLIYVRCLSKKLSPSAFTKVQLDFLKILNEAVLADKMTVTDHNNSANNKENGAIIKLADLQNT